MTEDRFPRVVPSGDKRHLIWKVAAVRITESGTLVFAYEDGQGNRLLMGPGFPDLVNDKVPLAKDRLAQSGLETPDEINYVISSHSGANPGGMPVCLLRSLDEIPERFKKKE
jgi:hypothetical protein